MKNHIIIALFLVLSQFANAQESKKKVKFMAKVETRNAFVQTRHVTFLTVRAGVEFRIPLRVGIGYSWMLSRFDSQLFDPSEYPQVGATAQPRMRYAMMYGDYSFYKEDNWELSVPVQIGIGETYYRSANRNRFANGLVVPLEAGVAVSYLFTRWVGFGVGLGYRFMLLGNKRVKENFTSPYYELKLNILLTEIFRGRKKKKKSG
ncbi:MAG: outer membrane beta-barrel protein [Flavobacteriales bacterium]|nr:outer membrane beta-barrel protein [Flavobacteriales bacterium]